MEDVQKKFCGKMAALKRAGLATKKTGIGFVVSLCAGCLALASSPASALVVYVDKDATGAGTEASWTELFCPPFHSALGECRWNEDTRISLRIVR